MLGGVTAAERLDNVRYELGDAQVHRFDTGAFDVALSRFGTMFFSDPAAAFANIAGALRLEGPPGAARLAAVRGQRVDAGDRYRAGRRGAKAKQPGADPFSLGDAGTTTGILEGAGFRRRPPR